MLATYSRATRVRYRSLADRILAALGLPTREAPFVITFTYR